ncbi:MAG: tetratricopeptide repeat protein [Planctomycetota bacterium]|jgi:tetratricopeptide (TPR) repeat protein
MDTANLKDVELALDDTRTAKSMLPDSPVALAQDLVAHLVAANVYEETQQEAKRNEALAEAEQDAGALQRFARSPNAHWARAFYFEHVGNDEDAVAELRAGAEDARVSGHNLIYYAAALHRRGHFEGALAVLERWEESSQGFLDQARAFVLVELPDGQQRALKEYRNARERHTSGPVGMLHHQMLFRLLGRKSEGVEASRGLREQFAGMPRWILERYQGLLDYSCDLLSAEALLKEAGDSRQYQCQAHFFIGITLLSEGDRAGAITHFQSCRDTDVFFLYVHHWSRAFLEHLEQDPTWPPWIPLRESDGARPATESADPVAGERDE